MQKDDIHANFGLCKIHIQFPPVRSTLKSQTIRIQSHLGPANSVGAGLSGVQKE